MSNTESIEFQNISSTDTQQDIVRKSFRIPVAQDLDITVTIDGKSYPVVDISGSGISITTSQETLFPLDRELTNCRLDIDGTVLEKLSGKIIHFSSQPNNQWVSGLKWVSLSRDQEQVLKKKVEELKLKLLSNIDESPI